MGWREPAETEASTEKGQAETTFKMAFEPLDPAVPEAPLLEFSASSIRKHLLYLIVLSELRKYHLQSEAS